MQRDGGDLLRRVRVRDLYGLTAHVRESFGLNAILMKAAKDQFGNYNNNKMIIGSRFVPRGSGFPASVWSVFLSPRCLRTVHKGTSR